MSNPALYYCTLASLCVLDNGEMKWKDACKWTITVKIWNRHELVVLWFVIVSLDWPYLAWVHWLTVQLIYFPTAGMEVIRWMGRFGEVRWRVSNGWMGEKFVVSNIAFRGPWGEVGSMRGGVNSRGWDTYGSGNCQLQTPPLGINFQRVKGSEKGCGPLDRAEWAGMEW